MEITAKVRKDRDVRKREAVFMIDNTAVMIVSITAASASVDRVRRRGAGSFIEAIDFLIERVSRDERDIVGRRAR